MRRFTFIRVTLQKHNDNRMAANGTTESPMTLSQSMDSVNTEEEVSVRDDIEFVWTIPY